jgi:thioredoxin 1
MIIRYENRIRKEIRMLQLDRNNFEEIVLQGEGAILVDYYGDGCVPLCRADAARGSARGKIRRQNPLSRHSTPRKHAACAISQRILGLPVVAIYKDGEKVEELVKDDCDSRRR